MRLRVASGSSITHNLFFFSLFFFEFRGFRGFRGQFFILSRGFRGQPVHYSNGQQAVADFLFYVLPGRVDVSFHQEFRQFAVPLGDGFYNAAVFV